ncbi:hypothetical protein [Mesorhizobium sp. 2RAF21]|uniref:hypothetical protein n=1 Tax=Mesorhizobium sp. 2RAF21 TaxID=3232995 RepID=UPI003F973B4C
MYEFDWDTDEYRAARRASYERIRDSHPKLVTCGFDCWAGWHPILERFFGEVAAALAANPGTQFELWQVKEKMGSLRIYYVVPRTAPRPMTVREDDVRRRVDEAYERAEEEASHSCEVCGRSGVLRSLEGFFCTRCDDHADGAVPVVPEGGKE